MTPLTEMMDQKGFVKSLIESIPCGLLVVDSDRRVRAVNDVLERTFGITMGEALQKRGGEALRCVHAFKRPEGCGFSEECNTCGVRNTALEAISGNRVQRKRADIQLLGDGGKTRNLALLVSAAPMDYQGEKLAIIVLEDITELNSLRRRLKRSQSFSGIIGKTPEIQELFNIIKEVAEVEIPVLVQGESGTGKELVATAIHNLSLRKDKPFVPVNCAALPKGVFESELFGHVKGSFTGAIRDKKGRFELAHKGTLLLDEVADLPKALQAKLLRVLQEHSFQRLGGEKTVHVDVRLISSTNQDLKQEVAKGNFRKDLYYRIAVVPIHVPPLRERRDDIPILAEHFLERAKKEGQETAGFAQETLAVIMEYPWPGNVRELESTVRFALLKSGGREIQIEHLPLEVREWKMDASSGGPLRKLDRKSVGEALRESGGNKAKAARILGVGRATLYRFLADFPNNHSA